MKVLKFFGIQPSLSPSGVESGSFFGHERPNDFSILKSPKNVSRNEKKNIYFSKCKHLIVSDHLNFFPRKKNFLIFPFFFRKYFRFLDHILLYVKNSNNLQYSEYRPISQSYVAKRGVTCNGLCDITNVT